MSANRMAERAVVGPVREPPASALQVDTVSDYGSLLALAPEWNRLVEDAAARALRARGVEAVELQVLQLGLRL